MSNLYPENCVIVTKLFNLEVDFTKHSLSYRYGLSQKIDSQFTDYRKAIDRINHYFWH